MPVNTLKPPPREALLSKLAEKLGLDKYEIQSFRELFQRSDVILKNDGSIQAVANVSGRTEPLSTTLQNVDATGILLAAGADFSRAYVNKDTDHITDGTGSPLTGGKRGFVALDSNNRLSGSFRNNALNVNYAPTSSTVLSNDGVSHTITIAASTVQYGDGQVSYNSGSVDPGAFGTYYVYADDPTFAGGAVTYAFSATLPDQAANNDRVTFGAITTAGGSANTGGGTTGGTTTGGAGGRGLPGL